MTSEEFVLFSGGAKGTEAEFGAQAERFGVQEVNFTFEGHQNERRRGLRVLTTEELQQGDVSLTYVSKLMNRTYSTGPRFRKVLQSIWHQINNAEEVFVVGRILPDATVRGGPVGVPSSPNCATSRCTLLTRKKTAGFSGRRIIGRKRRK